LSSEFNSSLAFKNYLQLVNNKGIAPYQVSLGSNCLGSNCLGSNCLGSNCLGSNCHWRASVRTATVVREQVSKEQMSVGSKCRESKCPGSSCRGSNYLGCTFRVTIISVLNCLFFLSFRFITNYNWKGEILFQYYFNIKLFIFFFIFRFIINYN
jgi:hypothetical protein